MNINKIGLTVLVVICLVAILLAGLYFSPTLSNFDPIKNPVVNHQLNKTLQYPNTQPTQTPDIKQLPTKQSRACLSAFSAFDRKFNENKPYKISLADWKEDIKPNKKGITRINATEIQESQIIALDSNQNIITKQFMDKILELSDKYNMSFGTENTEQDIHKFYTQGCIEVRYLELNGYYYIHPLSPIK